MEVQVAQREKFEADVMKYAKALSKIQNGVTGNIFPRITRAQTAKEAWEILEKEFQGDSKVKTIKLQTLRREFHNLKMKESECIQDYSSRVVEVVNQIRTLGEEMSDQQVVEKILISLPEKYDSIVSAIEESNDLTTLSLEQLMGSLKSHEQRRLRRNNEQSVESAFQSKLTFKSKKFFKKGNARDNQQGGEHRRWKKDESSKRDDAKSNKDNKPFCKICNKSNHDTADCFNRGKPKCHYCNKFGHVEKECRFKNSNQANFAEKDDAKEGILFYAGQSKFGEENNVWYVDSGCSNHMTSNEKLFVDLDTSITPRIKTGDDYYHQALGKGTSPVQTKRVIPKKIPKKKLFSQKIPRKDREREKVALVQRKMERWRRE